MIQLTTVQCSAIIFVSFMAGAMVSMTFMAMLCAASRKTPPSHGDAE